MSISVVNTTGGLFNGSGSRPNGTAANGLTGVAGDVFMLTVYSSRSLSSGNFDFHSVSSVTAAGVTFTKVFSQNYQYQESSGSFPAASCHVDVFLGVATGTMTQVSFDCTMAAAGDTFINDGWFSMHTIRGLDTTTILDTATPNPKADTNVSLSASIPSISSINILASDSIQFFLQFMHTVGGSQAGGSPPSGFTVPGAGAGSHFKSEQATATKIDGCVSYKLYSGAQSGLLVSAGSSDNCWFAASIALRQLGATLANTKRSFATVIN